MQLEQLASQFSNKILDWPIIAPSKIIPLFIKTFIKNSWGKKFSVNDYHKKFYPSKFELSTRKFQMGDPLNTMSRQALLRQNTLQTKLDWQTGRKNILILFHVYENMTYQSEHSSVNKGQIANAVSGLLELIHIQRGQKVTIKKLNGTHFANELKMHAHEINQYNEIYILSDFLFNIEDKDITDIEIKECLKYLNLKNIYFLLIRDSEEIEPEINKTEKMESWINSNDKKYKYNSNKYKKNITNQIKQLDYTLSINNNNLLIISQKTTLDSFLKNLSMLMFKMYKIN
jgi:hypothetical protein